MRAAVHVELGVDAALEVVDRQRADPEQPGNLGAAVPGGCEREDLELAVRHSACRRPRVPAALAPHQRQHRLQAVRLGNERGDAGPARGGQRCLGRVLIRHDHVQLGEAPDEISRRAADPLQPETGVKEHDIGSAELTQRRHLIGIADHPDDGDVRPGIQTRR